MLLNRHNLSLAALASRDETRFAIGGVYVTATETVATDGHCLGRVTLPAEQRGDFPPVAGVEETTADLTPCIIPRDAAERLMKQLPRKTHLPILRNALVDVAATNANGTFRAVTTDLDTTQPLEVRKVDAEYPAIDHVMPKDTPSLRIGFNAELLARVLKVAAAMGPERSHAVELEFTTNANPVKITVKNADTGQVGTFLVMPMRL